VLLIEESVDKPIAVAAGAWQESEEDDDIKVENC
jgi:hypothetical protein